MICLNISNGAESRFSAALSGSIRTLQKSVGSPDHHVGGRISRKTSDGYFPILSTFLLRMSERGSGASDHVSRIRCRSQTKVYKKKVCRYPRSVPAMYKIERLFHDKPQTLGSTTTSKFCEATTNHSTRVICSMTSCIHSYVSSHKDIVYDLTTKYSCQRLGLFHSN